MNKLIFIVALISAQGHSAPTSSSFENQVIIENVAFNKLGTYRGFTDGIEYQKSYFYPKYSLKAPWLESRAICKSYNLELTTIETLIEAQAILNLANSDNLFRGVYAYFDAMTLTIKSPTDWYWTKSGKKISFALPWRSGEPNNYNNSNEVCLALAQFGFLDVPCTNSIPFVCQKIDFMISSALQVAL